MGVNSKKSQETYSAGLVNFEKFLLKEGETLEGIIDSLKQQKRDIYELLTGFVSYLALAKLSTRTISVYISIVRSYLDFHDIDINMKKFKRKVKVPKIEEEDEEALETEEIRNILLSCNNRRLKPYLLCLASGGFRATEALAMRLMDIDFTSNPTMIHVRKEYAKTRKARDVYISDEATRFLKQWIDWKYRAKAKNYRTYTKNNADLVFASHNKSEEMHPPNLYKRFRIEFSKVLKTVGLDARKDSGKRGKLTLHSFRRNVKTVLSDQISKDYSEWFLGHKKSTYYVHKQSLRGEMYRDKCMRYLTFLDYEVLEAAGKGIQNQLTEKDKQIATLQKELNELRISQQKSAEVYSQIALLKMEFEAFKEQMRKKVE